MGTPETTTTKCATQHSRNRVTAVSTSDLRPPTSDGNDKVGGRGSEPDMPGCGNAAPRIRGLLAEGGQGHGEGIVVGKVADDDVDAVLRLNVNHIPQLVLEVLQV